MQARSPNLPLRSDVLESRQKIDFSESAGQNQSAEMPVTIERTLEDRMKRDWDLIRKQLTDIEEDKDVLADLPPKPPKWEDDELEADFMERLHAHEAIEERILGHLELLTESGYVDGLRVTRGASGHFMVSRSKPRLTMEGHDLLDTMRSATVWNTIKDTAQKKGIELSFEAIKALGAFALKQVLGG